MAGLRTAVELSQLSANTLANATQCVSLSTVGKLAFSQEQEETLQPESEVLDPVASPEAQHFFFQSMTAIWLVFDVLRKAGFEEGAEGDGENLKFESNNSSAAVLFETDMTRFG